MWFLHYCTKIFTSLFDKQATGIVPESSSRSSVKIRLIELRVKVLGLGPWQLDDTVVRYQIHWVISLCSISYPQWGEEDREVSSESSPKAKDQGACCLPRVPPQPNREFLDTTQALAKVARHLAEAMGQFLHPWNRFEKLCVHHYPTFDGSRGPITVETRIVDI